MPEVGVIALDPVRLSALEVYLDGLGVGCRRGARRVADEVAGSGVDAAGPSAELDRLAAACHRERDEVAWRRALVEALPRDLPLTRRRHASRTAAREAAEALADDVVAALDAHRPDWARLSRLLAELDRSSRSATFTATFFAAIGPRRARQLPLVLEQAWAHADAEPALAGPAAVLAAQGWLAAALRTASRVTGPGALGERWCRVYAGLPPTDAGVAADAATATPAQRREAVELEQGLRAAGYGLALATRVAQAVGWRRAAAALTVDQGLLGLVTAPLALTDGDGIACDGAEALFGAAAAGITVVGAVAGGPATLAAGVLTGLALLFGACRPQDPRPSETRPRTDPATGESRLPSGHQTNPHVDVAGVPLPPSYG